MPYGRQVAVIDCQTAGISGDMLLAALLDLGADTNKVVEAVKSVKSYLKKCKGLEVVVRDVSRRGLRAKKIDFRFKEVAAIEASELIDATLSCVEDLELSGRARRFASDAINTLVEAEAKVHGSSVEEVRLHEAGSADTVAEIVGVAVALDDLNLFGDVKVYSTPVAVGGGTFEFSHGVVSSPAPATVEILRSKSFPMTGGPVYFELATPTGVSLLVNLVHEAVEFYPLIKLTTIGYGAGARDLSEMPNVLRIILGRRFNSRISGDKVYVLETNIDDVSGEIIGYVMDRLLREGARDVNVIPMFTKKNRPGHIIKVIADEADVERFSSILIEETGSLGVRVYPCKRYIVRRESFPVDIELEGVKCTINVKVARDREGRVVQVKPEYDEVKELADETGKPFKEVAKMAEIKAREVLTGG